MTDLRREITQLFNYFQDSVGEVVDLNLDYLPDFMIVTFHNSKAAQAVFPRSPLKYTRVSGETWNFVAKSVNFTIPIRNCNNSEDLPPNKYLPIWANKERALTAKNYLSD